MTLRSPEKAPKQLEKLSKRLWWLQKALGSSGKLGKALKSLKKLETLKPVKARF